MNNYSWIHQKLHQIALSNHYIRELTFDIESSLIFSEDKNENHVFISGLARSGSTILLNAIYKSNEFSSLSYKDMPFVLAPNIWSKISLHKEKNTQIERAHADGIKISADSPEAFEEVFWMTFDNNQNITKKKFKNYVQLINHSYKKERYLSKNNQNIKRLDLIAEIFPLSTILIPFRNPIQHAFSLLSQHKRFIEYSKKDKFISSYMGWIGHTEFGPNYIPIHNKNLNFIDYYDINHWLEQWYISYQICHDYFNNKENFHFICYEQLCSSKKYWLNILNILNIKETYDFDFYESYKNISLEIDGNIMKKTLNLYTKISESQKSF